MERYYCLTCDTTVYMERCPDCGEVADALCETCGDTFDNCDCEPPEELDDSPNRCPDCERPTQFGGRCPACQRDVEHGNAEGRL